MTDIYTDIVIDDVNGDNGLSDNAKDFLDNLLNDLSNADGQNQVEAFDPASGTPPPDGTDVLIIPPGLGGGTVELNSDNLGNVPIIDGRAADSGISVDLEAEDGTSPATRVVLGSDFADEVIGGRSDLLLDLGAGNDTATTGDGNDQLFMGTGDDTIILGGSGNDVIHGGDGTDGLTLSGSMNDWSQIQNQDGSLTWFNSNTGQTVTTFDVELINFSAGSDGSENDWQEIQNQDGSLTWLNTSTGQLISSSNQNHRGFEPDPHAQMDNLDDPDPDDV